MLSVDQIEKFSATHMRCGPLCAQNVARRVTRAAVSKRLDQISAPVPLPRLVFADFINPWLKIQQLPECHHRPVVKGKNQIILRRANTHRFDRLQISEHGQYVIVAGFGVSSVRKGRIQMITVRAHAMAQRVQEIDLAPVANSGKRVWRDVRGIDRAERRSERQSTAHEGTVLSCMATGAVSSRDQILAARDQLARRKILRMNYCPGLDYRHAPQDDAGTDQKHKE